MKFVFRLEAVLKQRQQVEAEAQREYLQAKAQLDECLERIEVCYRDIRQTRQQIAEAEKSARVGSLDWIQQAESYMKGLEIKIHRERQTAREHMMEVEAKQEVLVEAAKERKAMDVLRERKWQEHRVLLRKMESKELDDISVMRAKRSQLR